MPASQPALVCRGFRWGICQDVSGCGGAKEKRQRFTLPGPEEAGGSQEMVAGFRQAIKNWRHRIVDIARGDNDIEDATKLTRGNAGAYPDANVVAGSAIAAEGGDGRRARVTTPLTIVILSDASGFIAV